MAFRLAAHFGCTVRELLARVDSRELSEWRAFERLEGPIGQKRDDILTAMVVSSVVNSNRSRTKPYPLEKFIPEWDQTKKTADELLATVRQINAAMGGTET